MGGGSVGGTCVLDGVDFLVYSQRKERLELGIVGCWQRSKPPDSREV